MRKQATSPSSVFAQSPRTPTDETDEITSRFAEGPPGGTDETDEIGVLSVLSVGGGTASEKTAFARAVEEVIAGPFSGSQD